MEEQYLEIEIPRNVMKLGLDKYLPQIDAIKLPVNVQQKPKHEFQEIIKQYAPVYGKRMYTLPYEVWFSEYKFRLSHEQCVKYKQVGNVNYLIKVMRNLKTL